MDTLADISSNITTVAGVSSNVTTVAGISGNVTAVAGNATNINAVAADATDIGAVAGKATEIGRLGTADAVADLAILGTTDVVADLNTLGTTAIVSDMDTLADISTDITSVANNESNINAAVSNASNINAAVSNASNINAAVSNASNINTVAGINSNVTTVAGIASNVSTVAGNNADISTVAGNDANITTVAGINSNISTVAGSIANVNTAASNVTNINNFANRYRIASGAPSSNNDEGDLYFDTTSNELRVYNGSAWQGGVTATGNLAGLGANTFTGNQTINANINVTGTVDGTLANGVTATTQSASDNSTKVATTAYTDTAIANLVDSSPTALNTLNELAAAIGDDANFSTTITNSLATKLATNGDGSNVTNLNASNIASGTIAAARVPTLNQDTTGNAATVSVTNTNASGTFYPVFSSGTGSSTIYNDVSGALSFNPSTNILTASYFAGNGGNLTNLNASNITSGLISSARIPTLNQNTTGSSGSCTGNAATASQAANAALLDNIDSSSFLRSDQEDFISGQLNISGGTGNSTNDGTLYVTADNNNDWGIVVNKYRSAATEYGMEIRVGASATYAFSVLGNGSRNFRINGNGDVTQNGALTASAFYGDGANITNVNATTLDSIDSSAFLRSDQNDSTSGVLSVKSLGFVGTGSDSGNSAQNYNIYQQSGSWQNPYPDLIIAYHTGIKIGAHKSYGGTRFYNDAPENSATEIFSVGNGDNHVRVLENLYVSGRTYIDNTTNYLSYPTGNYGSIQINNTGAGTWEGFSIDGRAVFMHDGNSGTGIYNDVNNEWLFYAEHNSSSYMYNNGSQRIEATANGGKIHGTDLYVGTSTHSNIYMSDSDNTTRRIHCNSNRIGFLNSSNGWGSYCDNAGNWVSTGNVTAYSDARLKTNVKTIDNALDIVDELRGVSFDWKRSGEHSIGVIAQEVEKVLPELVVTGEAKNPDTEEIEEFKSVDYGKMVGVLINAIKELRAEVAELKEGK